MGFVRDKNKYIGGFFELRPGRSCYQSDLILFLVNVHGINVQGILDHFTLDQHPELDFHALIGTYKILDLIAGFSLMNNIKIAGRKFLKEISDDQFCLVFGIVSLVSINAEFHIFPKARR